MPRLPSPASPPAIYRPGDTQRTSTGKINLLPPPSIAIISVAGSGLSISGAGGIPGGTYSVLISTNVALPLNQWQRIATNAFDGAGRFQFSNPVNPDAVRQYYLLQLQ